MIEQTKVNGIVKANEILVMASGASAFCEDPEYVALIDFDLHQIANEYYAKREDGSTLDFITPTGLIQLLVKNKYIVKANKREFNLGNDSNPIFEEC